MSRNFGLGSRDMYIAGNNAIKKHYQSYTSRDTVKKRWDRFVDFVRAAGIRRMEHISVDHIREYAQTLVDDNLSPSTQQNYVSAVNSVMEIAREDREIRLDPSDICDSRTGIAQFDRSHGLAEHDSAKSNVSERTAVLLELQREFGLRFEESAKLDAARALEHSDCGSISIIHGTKGGRQRTIDIRNERQIEVLERAASIQGNGRSMIPSDQSYIDFKRAAYRELSQTDITFHAERHTYAQERYLEITQVPAPVKTDHNERSWSHHLARTLNIDITAARELDRNARLTISKELGHHREDVVSAYIGGKS